VPSEDNAGWEDVLKAMKQSKARKYAERLKEVGEESEGVVHRRKDGKKKKSDEKGANYEDAKESSSWQSKGDHDRSRPRRRYHKQRRANKETEGAEGAKWTDDTEQEWMRDPNRIVIARTVGELARAVKDLKEP
jgi:hypothetical protein